MPVKPKDVWLKTSEDAFCCEISTLQANGACVDNRITLPDESKIQLGDCTPEVNEDRDIVLWKYSFNGVRYVIFND